MITAPFTHDDYEILKREEPYKGVFRLARYHLKFKLFNGDWSEVVTRELLERQSAAAVLLYDPHADSVVLIQQFRLGVLAHNENPWLLEIVAGIFTPEEAPEKVAIREAEEEAGCVVDKLHFINDYFVSPGGSNERLYLFCGKVNSARVEGIYGLKEENEDIRAYVLPFNEALQLLTDGKIKTSPAIVSLQWLQLNKTWLQPLWQK